jgi:hypothetical protein
MGRSIRWAVLWVFDDDSNDDGGEGVVKDVVVNWVAFSACLCVTAGKNECRHMPVFYLLVYKTSLLSSIS